MKRRMATEVKFSSPVDEELTPDAAGATSDAESDYGDVPGGLACVVLLFF